VKYEGVLRGFHLGWWFALAIALTACGSEQNEPAPEGSPEGSSNGGAMSTTGSSTEGQSTTSMGGGGNSSGAHGGGSGGSGGSEQPVNVEGSGGSTTGAEGGSGGSAAGFFNTGLCAFAGEGVWEDGSYSGTHDLMLVGDLGVGEDLCVVRFEANTTSEPEVDCVVTSSGMQVPCSFGTVVELTNPTVVTDVDGVCGNSERALDEDGIAALVGERFGMGFAVESTGHGNILVRLDETMMTWTEWAGATFEPETGDLEYRQSDGVCDY